MVEVLTDTSPEGMLHAVQEDLRASWASYGAGPGCELLEHGQVTRLYTGLAAPVFNIVVSLRAGADDADGLIEDTLAYFRAKGVPMSWWLGPWTQPDDYDARLRRFGPAEVSSCPGMALDLGDLATVPPPPNVAIEEVSGEAALREYVALEFDAFGFGGASIDRMTAIDGAIGYGPGRDWRHFFAVRDGRLVAATSLFTGAGVAGIYGVATAPPSRGQGLASALVSHALHEARAAGYRIATLQSSEMGYHLYRRMGFQECCRISIYEWQPGPG